MYSYCKVSDRSGRSGRSPQCFGYFFWRISSRSSPIQARHPFVPYLVGMHLVHARPALRASSSVSNLGSTLDLDDALGFSGLGLGAALGLAPDSLIFSMNSFPRVLTSLRLGGGRRASPRSSRRDLSTHLHAHMPQDQPSA